MAASAVVGAVAAVVACKAGVAAMTLVASDVGTAALTSRVAAALGAVKTVVAQAVLLALGAALRANGARFFACKRVISR